MYFSPHTLIATQRIQLENALLLKNVPTEELVLMSQQLDRLINHMMCVRGGHFSPLSMRGVRKVRKRRP